MLDHMVTLFLVFRGTSVLFSIVAAPIYIPINSVRGSSLFSTPSPAFFLQNLFILFIYFWLRWAFVVARGLSLVAVSGGYSSLWCVGFSLRWLLLFWSTGSRCVAFSHCGMLGSVVVAHGLSCSATCGIFPDQGWNPCPLHWQADSQPLRHQGSP